MSEKKSFVLHKDYNNQIKKLSDVDAAALLRAIFAYVNGEEVCQLSPVADMVFSFIAAQIDRDNAKYKARCERNKANGKKGGRPKKEEPNETEENPKEPNKTERFSEKPKKPDNDNDSDNDNDNDSDNDVGGDDEISAVFTTFEHCGFQITGYTRDELIALMEEYSAEWVIEALKRSADRGKKTLAYVRGILGSWKVKGAIDNGVAEKKPPEIKPKIDESMDDLDDLY